MIVLWLLACSDFEPPKFEVDFVEPLDRIADCEGLCGSQISAFGGYSRSGCMSGCAEAEQQCPEALSEIYDCFWALEIGATSEEDAWTWSYCGELLTHMNADWIEGGPTCPGVELLQPGDTGW